MRFVMAFPFMCLTDIDYLCCLFSPSSVTFHIPKSFTFTNFLPKFYI